MFLLLSFLKMRSLWVELSRRPRLKSRHRQLAPFSLLDLSWSRSVARHAIRKVCDCVLPHSTLPHSGSEVSGLLSQLWTCSFREPLSLLGHPFLKILKVSVFGVFGHFWGPQVNACSGPILRVSWFWLFLMFIIIFFYNYFIIFISFINYFIIF